MALAKAAVLGAKAVGRIAGEVSVPAVRNRRVQAIAGAFLVVPGPRLGEAAEAIARAIHPDAF